MIIKNQTDVTAAVLAELERVPDERFMEIMAAAVRHLHEFVCEARLTEDEFHQVCAYVAAAGQRTSASHNEVVLASGTLGVSALVCLLNDGNKGQAEMTANLLGPFWRLDSPHTPNGGSIMRSPTPGPVLFVKAWVKDIDGKPVPEAEVDIWQSSTDGLYEDQDPGQAEMNLCGKFTTDREGHFGFRSVKPAGYPIPLDGPVGALARAQGRHNMRPAHLHFLIYRPGYKTQVSQVCVNDDPNLKADVQFGVTEALVGNYVRHDGSMPPASDVTVPWHTLDYTFVVEPGEARLPRPPVSSKATERARSEIVKRA